MVNLKKHTCSVYTNWHHCQFQIWSSHLKLFFSYRAEWFSHVSVKGMNAGLDFDVNYSSFDIFGSRDIMLRWMKCISFCLKHSNYVSFSSLFIAFLLCDPGLTYVPPINKRTIPKMFLYVCNLGLLCLAIWLYSEPYTYVIRWTCACFTKMNRLIFNDLFWNLSR